MVWSGAEGASSCFLEVNDITWIDASSHLRSSIAVAGKFLGEVKVEFFCLESGQVDLLREGKITWGCGGMFGGAFRDCLLALSPAS